MMVSDYLGQVRSLEELYALMDRDRIAAARFIESTFQADVEAAITNIVEISSVANARVLADTQVASAKLLIDAEVASTRLAAGAEMAIIEFKRLARDHMTAESSEHLEAMIQEVGRSPVGKRTTAHRCDRGRCSRRHRQVKTIGNAADSASVTLRQTADSALRNIHATTEEACAQIAASTTLAAKRVELSMEKDVVRIHEIQTLYLAELTNSRRK